MTAPSLLHLFNAPEGYDGLFGWICGYSADIIFLNDAAERFTRRTNAQRAHAGEISLALILDPHHESLSLLDVPGVAHLPLLRADNRPFKLMHAKVALLGFAKTGSEKWRVRLIVATGNWTQQTVEESLDLAWTIELASEDLVSGASDLSLRCADVKAASEMFEWLMPCFDRKILDAMLHNPGAKDRLDRFNSWKRQCVSLGSEQQSRFFDNRSQSILQQLPGLITCHTRGVRRNYLAMASGFFEDMAPGGRQSEAVPGVLDSIVKALRDNEMLTRNAQVEIYVNPESCQAVAVCQEAIITRGWSVLEPGQPERVFGPNARRTLHAKFLFSGNTVDKEVCTSGWLYMGSGNLTSPGFMEKANSARGNLEAGVLLPVSRTLWSPLRDTTVPALTVLLPIQADGNSLTIDSQLKAGDPMEEHKSLFLAAPVAYLQWIPKSGSGLLRAAYPSNSRFEILDLDEKPCERVGSDWFWSGAAPRQVMLRWGNQDYQQAVPVIDEFGRIAATELPELAVEDLAAQLIGFPIIVLDESDEAEDGAGTLHGNHDQKQSGSSQMAIRTMMTQLELIAQKQVQIAQTDWAAWCYRLEQTLCQARSSVVLDDFRPLGINPLSCLWHSSALPDYVCDTDEPHARCLQEALGRVTDSWEVQAYAAFGEKK